MSPDWTAVFDALPLFQNCTGAVLGVSGGPDSMAMLDLFQQARTKGLPFPFVCATLDHGLRPESAEEVRKVEDFCIKHGICFETDRADLSPEKTEGESLENAARKERYAFFERVKAQYGYSHIVTAHNADDNLETVLLNLVRGCGTDGLRGIVPLRKDNNTVRPLLAFTKAELTDYCESNGIPYSIDRSNKDTHYRRNFIRHKIVPLLKELNPSITDAVSRLSILAGEDREYLEEESRLVYARIRTEEELPLKELRSLPPALLSRVLRLYGEEQTGRIPDFRETEEVKSLVLTGNTSDHILFCGKDFRLSYTGLTCSKKQEATFPAFIPKPGTNPLPEGILTITEGIGYRGEPNCIPLQPLSEMLVRPRLEGDYMHTPQGCGKLIKKIFIDKKIPAEKRMSTPLLVKGDRILWAACIGTDPEFRPKAGDPYYRLQFNFDPYKDSIKENDS